MKNITDAKKFSDFKYKYARERIQPFKLKLLSLLLSETNGYVLDIGCGSGVLSKIMKEYLFHPVGLDISEEAMNKYCSNGLKGIVANLEYSIPMKKNSFHIVWLSEIIEHIANYENLITEIYRVLKPAGKLYLSTPNSSFFVYRLLYLFGKTPTQLQHPHHLRFFNYKMIINILKKNKFGIENVFGQNIYGFIPTSFIKQISQKSRVLGKLTEKIIKAMGFRCSEGYIHGDKYMLFSFSKRMNSLFSNSIMIVANKIAEN